MWSVESQPPQPRGDLPQGHRHLQRPSGGCGGLRALRRGSDPELRWRFQRCRRCASSPQDGRGGRWSTGRRRGWRRERSQLSSTRNRIWCRRNPWLATRDSAKCDDISTGHAHSHGRRKEEWAGERVRDQGRRQGASCGRRQRFRIGAVAAPESYEEPLRSHVNVEIRPRWTGPNFGVGWYRYDCDWACGSDFRTGRLDAALTLSNPYPDSRQGEVSSF